MTQLALVLALGLIGLALALVVGYVESSRGVISPTVKSIEGAVERAALALLRAGAGRTLLLLVAPAGGLVAYSLGQGAPSGQVSPGGRAIFCCVSLLGGAASALVLARLAVTFGTRSCSGAAAAISRGSARSLRPLLRAVGALAVFGEGLGLVGVAGIFASLYAVRGGFASPGGNLELALEVVTLLPSFALGSAVAALVLSREGSVLAVAASVGAARAGEQAMEFSPHDARSPAALAELLGQQVGGLVPRVLLNYVGGVTATISACLLAGAGGATEGGAERGGITCVLLVLVVRAFGVVGSGCGLLATRATEGEAPVRALLRGQASALLVTAFGVGAALYWLRVEHFLLLLWPTLAGLGSMALVTQLAWLPLRRGSAALRELSEARNLGEGAAIVRGSWAGFASVLPCLLLPPLALSLTQAAQPLGSGPSAAMLLAAFTAGVLASAPFSLAVTGFGLLSDTAHGVASLARLEPDAWSRGSKLEETGAVGFAAASPHATLAMAASLTLGLSALADAVQPQASLLGGPVLLAAATGAAMVLTFALRSSRSALRGAQRVADGIDQQFQGLPRRHGLAVVPLDFAPSYKSCVDAVLGAARVNSVMETASLLVVPFLLAAGLVTYAANTSRLALLAFAGAAVLGGLPLSLGARATRGVLAEVRRRSRSTNATGEPCTTGGAHAFGELLGLTAATSAEALVCALTLTILSLAPLLG